MASGPLSRPFADLASKTFDVLVVGGGINGAGVARDAARRGLSVALVEREDFGYGTTGRSTRLVHGGLRYLALYDFGLVHESLRERERLLANAPHLVRPIRFLIPFYKGQATPPWKLKLGLWLYDALAGSRSVQAHESFSRDEVLEVEPGLQREGLRGGAAYSDGQVAFVERLCVENILDAVAHGACVVNHAGLDRLVLEDGRVVGARVRDMLSGEEVEVRARRIVNTTGPWVDRVPGVGGVRTRMTKGIHLVTPRDTNHAILLFSPDDDRVFFSIPWMGQQLVGTTDTDYTAEPADVRADAGDVAYLQRGIRLALPDAPVETIHYTYAGLRNLVPEPGKSESDVSRRHEVVRHANGLEGVVSLVGGKITPYRATCEEVVDAIELTRTRSDTARAPLPGAPESGMDDFVSRLDARVAALGLDPRCSCALASTYGARAHAVLDTVEGDPAMGALVCEHAPMLLAEARFVVEHEMARTAADVLIRRATPGWLACEGRDALPAVLDVLDDALGRTLAERKADEAAFLAELDSRHAWKREPQAGLLRRA